MLEPNEIIVTMAAATRKSLQLTEPLVNVHDVFVQLNVTHLLKQSDHDDRFFLASRLGRYIMYEHSEGKNIFPPTTVSEMYYNANEFAANFLMPKHLHLREMNRLSTNETINVAELASVFGVTTNQALNRGRYLGVLD